jgi:hypothetical protein
MIKKMNEAAFQQFYLIEGLSVQFELDCLQLQRLLANRSHDHQLLLEAGRLVDPITFVCRFKKLF